MKRLILSTILIMVVKIVSSQWYQTDFKDYKGDNYKRYVSNVDNSFSVILEEKKDKVLLYIADNYFCEDSVLVYFMFNYSGKFIRESVIGKLNESVPNSLVLCDDFLNSPLLEYITYSDAFRIKVYQNKCASLNSIFELEYTATVVKQLKKRRKQWLKENNTGAKD